MAGSGVFAGAAGVIDVNITAVGPAVVGIVVEPGGSGGLDSTLAVAAVVGASRWCWSRSCHGWLGGEGLGKALLNDGGDIWRGRDNAGERGRVGDGGNSDGGWLKLFNEQRELFVLGLGRRSEGGQLSKDGIDRDVVDHAVGDAGVT